jgi:hypothetical protein
MHATGAIALAGPKVDKESRRAEKVKAGIAKLGVGEDARIAVMLKDKTKLSGYLSQVNDDSFVVNDLKTGASTTVAYTEVTQVQGHNLSTGVKIAIGVGLVVVLLVVLYLALRSAAEGFHL